MSITLQTVSSGYNLSAINTNFQSLQTALNNNILWREGSVAGEAMMNRDLDMNGNSILNVDVDLNNPGSLLTVGVADSRYYNVSGDTLTGTMNVNGQTVTGVKTPLAFSEAVNKGYADAIGAIAVDAGNKYSNLITLIGTLLQGGYTLLGDYTAGPYTFTSRSQIISYNGYFYAPSLSASIPFSTTGTNSTSWEVDKGKFVVVGDAALRQELNIGTSVYVVPGMSVDTTTDNRVAAYAFPGKIFIPLNTTIRCNFLPTDDVRKFTGEGKILSRDPWGNEQVFDVALSMKGPQDTPKMRVNSAAFRKTNVSIGIIGDSITDGLNTNGYYENPYDVPTNNLNSTNYNHMLNGGNNSWFRWFIETLGISHFGYVNKFNNIKGYNAAHVGAGFLDGWAYRNLDYGFFQNSAYENKMPNVVMISMGENDAIQSFSQETLIDLYDAFIRKCWGYGATVAVVGIPMGHIGRMEVEQSVKAALHDKYPKVEYLDVSYAIDDSLDNLGVGGNGGDAISLRGGQWDVTHPAQATHYRMGTYCAYLFSPQRFIHAKPNTKFLPVTHDKFMVETSTGNIGSPISSTSGPESIPGTSDADTNSMIARYVWWPYSALNTAVYIRYMIWCDADQEVDLTSFYITPSIYPGGTTKSIICRLSHQIRSDAATDPSCIASIGTEIEPVTGTSGYDYRSVHIARLKRGLNIFEVIHANASTYAALPMLYFSSAESLGFSRVNLAGITSFVNGTDVMALDGQSLPIYYPAALSLNGRSYNDEVPDYYQCGLGEITQSATFDFVSPLSNFSVVMKYKPTRNTYLIADFSGTPGSYVFRVNVKGINGSTTVTAPITDAQYNYVNTGGKFTVVSNTFATYVVFEDIGATPSYVNINIGATGGTMAVRRTNTSLSTTYRCVQASNHFTARNNSQSNLNQTPV